jgi:hypothetical protein
MQPRCRIRFGELSGPSKQPGSSGPEAGVDALLADEDTLRHTRVPSEPPDGFAAFWLGRYLEGWRNRLRPGFALQAHR